MNKAFLHNEQAMYATSKNKGAQFGRRLKVSVRRRLFAHQKIYEVFSVSSGKLIGTVKASGKRAAEDKAKKEFKCLHVVKEC